MNVQKRRRGHKAKRVKITEKLRPIIPDELKKEENKKTCTQVFKYVPAMKTFVYIVCYGAVQNRSDDYKSNLL